MSVYDRITIICSTLGQLSAVFVPAFFIVSGLEILSEKLTTRIMQFDLQGWVEGKLKEVEEKRKRYDKDAGSDA